MEHAFKIESANTETLKTQLANLKKGVVDGGGEMWDSNPDYGQLIGAKLDAGNVSDSSDSCPYSEMSDCGSDVESCLELSREDPNGSQIWRRSWRSKSSPSKKADSDSTDSTGFASNTESGASKVPHQVRIIRTAMQGKDLRPDARVLPTVHEVNSRSCISTEEQKPSLSGATTQAVTKPQGQKNNDGDNGNSNVKGEAYMQDQKPTLLERLKADASLSDPEIQKEIGEMISMESDPGRY